MYYDQIARYKNCQSDIMTGVEAKQLSHALTTLNLPKKYNKGMIEDLAKIASASSIEAKMLTKYPKFRTEVYINKLTKEELITILTFMGNINCKWSMLGDIGKMYYKRIARHKNCQNPKISSREAETLYLTLTKMELPARYNKGLMEELSALTNKSSSSQSKAKSSPKANSSPTAKSPSNKASPNSPTSPSGNRFAALLQLEEAGSISIDDEDLTSTNEDVTPIAAHRSTPTNPVTSATTKKPVSIYREEKPTANPTLPTPQKNMFMAIIFHLLVQLFNLWRDVNSELDKVLSHSIHSYSKPSGNM